MRMRSIHHLCIVWIVVGVACSAPAAEKNTDSKKLERLPEPLSDVSGNISDLENSGHFEIIHGIYGKTEEREKAALVWTVKVAKPLTCEYAMTLLRAWSDVRFYRTDKDGRAELHATELYYSERITTGAAASEALGVNDRFQVWILLNAPLVETLRESGVDSVVFSRHRRLPQPLNDITGNFADLEKSGHFRIIKEEFGRTKGTKQEALIWTLRVVKPLSYQHAVIVLRRLSDVRFYRVVKDWRKQYYSTELYYPSYIANGAIRNESLDLDEWLRVWVLLDEKQIWHLKHHRANTVEFRELKR